jgi:AraC-like DNA-binding protein/mannose-6-phosphate isomerase-like protein (cupin superfamily)
MNYLQKGGIKLSNVVVVKDDTPWRVPMHSHDDFVEIIFVCKGRGTVTFHGEKIDAEMGDILVYNQDVLHEECSDPDLPLSLINISLHGQFVEELPKNHILPDGMRPVLKTEELFSLFYALFSFVRDIYSRNTQGAKELCTNSVNLVLSLIQELVRRNLERNISEETTPSVTQDIMEYISKNYFRNIRLKDLEEQFHFSQYYLARKFKEETGYTINEYITNRRIGEAGKLLIYTDLPVAVIAHRVGYENPSHFSAAFKKNMGISPGKMKEVHNRI